MREEMRQWVFDGFQGMGGDVEYIPGSDTASLLLEKEIAESLEIPEFCALDFADNGQGGDGRVNFSNLVEKLELIASNRGKLAWARFEFPDNFVWPSEKKASLFLSTSGGKVAFDEARLMDQTYMIVYSRCSAVADEKREVILGTAVNSSSLTISLDLAYRLESLLGEGKSGKDDIQVSRNVLDITGNTLEKEARRNLVDFEESTTKRMYRDAERLYKYYNELYRAAHNPSGRRKADSESVQAAAEAVVHEYKRKMDDLRIKYLTRVTIEPLCVLFLTMPCLVSWFDVYMGVKKIRVAIPWNGITRRQDVTLCKKCGNDAGTAHVCRELHWLCDNCWTKCPLCGREYCPLCKPKGCGCGG